MRLRTPRDIGAAIRDRRKVLGLDQGKLAARVGVSRLWINQMERGKPRASLHLILRTFSALGLALTSEQPSSPRDDSERMVSPDINAIVGTARGSKRA